MYRSELEKLISAARKVHRASVATGQLTVSEQVELLMAIKQAEEALGVQESAPQPQAGYNPPVNTMAAQSAKTLAMAMRRVGDLHADELSHEGYVYVAGGWGVAQGGDHFLKVKGFYGEGWPSHKQLKSGDAIVPRLVYQFVAKVGNYWSAGGDWLNGPQRAESQRATVIAQARQLWEKNHRPDDGDPIETTWVRRGSINDNVVTPEPEGREPFEFQPQGYIRVEMADLVDMAQFACSDNSRPVLATVAVQPTEMVAADGFIAGRRTKATEMEGTAGAIIPRQVVDQLRLLKVKDAITIEIGVASRQVEEYDSTRMMGRSVKREPKVVSRLDPAYRIDFGDVVFEGWLPGALKDYPDFSRIDPTQHYSKPLLKVEFTSQQWRDNMVKLGGIADKEVGMVALAFNGHMTGYWFDRTKSQVSSTLGNDYYLALENHPAPTAISIAIKGQDGPRVVSCEAESIESQGFVVFVDARILSKALISSDKVTMTCYSENMGALVVDSHDRTIIMPMDVRGR